MKNKVVSMLLLVTMIASLLPGSLRFVRMASATQLICEGTVGGQWSADSWCEIDSVAEMNGISSNTSAWTVSYRLTGNIDLSAYNGQRIGNGSIDFTGKFDGNGYTLSNLTIHSTANNVGFFGSTSLATIQNVRLVNVNIAGTSYVGGLVGYAFRTTIINSSAEGVVTGIQTIGGLVGYNDTSTITDSYSQGEVVLDASPMDSFGGLVGYSSGTIVGSYTTAKVGNGTAAGGLVGDQVANPALITKSYWNGDTSGVTVSDGGTQSNTANMKLKSTYVAWDFTSANPTWGMIEKITYPLHYADYKKAALASLNIEDPDGPSPIVWDSDFAEDYGVYELRVVNKTDTLKISAAAMSATSVVSFYSDSDITDGNPPSTLLADPNAIPLNEGKNVIGVQVTGDGGQKAMYLLTVNRDAGTVAYPHRITTADELAQIGQPSNGYGYDLDDAYVLEADLDLSAYGTGSGWLPIGTFADPFIGTFDGRSHAISHLKIDRPGQSDIGLFGSARNARIATLSLLGVDIQGGDRVGGLIGSAAGNLSASRVTVQGAVYGDNGVGGLIGSSSAVLNMDESYSAASVQGVGTAGGLIGTHTGTGTITDSFWDKEVSGQASSSGGGTGQTTAVMKAPATYTNWSFVAPDGWGIIEGTTYPMPYKSLQGVLVNSMTVTIGGTNAPLSFDPIKGLYTLTRTAPVPEAQVSVVSNDAGAMVKIAGHSGATNNVDLDFGTNNVIDILVTGTNGWQGVYKLTITVPVPKPIAISVPADAKYGIGDPLDFTVTYDYSVEIDADNPPALPIETDGGTKLAAYVGQPSAEPEKLMFRYTVQEGDTAIAGIELGDELVASAPGSILGDDDTAFASMELPSTLPSTSGVAIDGIKPTIGLTPSTADPTRDSITVAVNAEGTGTDIASLKMGKGIRDVSYFAASGTPVTGDEFVADDNGNYTVYARDEAGNERVETVAIANIVSENPTILLNYLPNVPTRGSVVVSVTASVYNAASNALESLKWAAGSLATDDFDDPSFGTDIVAGTFTVSANGDYTVYALDTAGNERAETIAIGNIVTASPTILLDYGPRTPTKDAVVISVTASVYHAAGNELESLRWAQGTLTANDFDDPSFGADVAAGTFSVTANGAYTVYALDTAGNEEVQTLAISNIESSPVPSDSSSDDYDPNLRYFLIDPDKENTLTFDGLTLRIPAGAVDSQTFVTVEVVTDTAKKLVPSDSRLLSKAYELKKNSPGTFNVPIELSMEWTGEKLGPDKKVVLSFYDEKTKQWVALTGKSKDSNVTGQTDHFTLFAAIEAKAEPSAVLSDIAGHWAESAIREGAAAGLAGGYPDGTFRPEQPVSRAEFVTMLNRLFQWPDGEKPNFRDNADILPWANESVAAAVHAGVANGYPDGSFRPGARITRAEAAVMIAKANGLRVGEVKPTTFADDADIANWTKPYINAAYEAGLVQGQGGNKFNPQANMTRAEAVVFLLRLSDRLQ